GQVLASLDKSLHQCGQVVGGCSPLTHHTEGVNLSSDRRYRCRSYHIPTRTTWRSTQLGLSLLLVARCHFYSPRTDEFGLLRRGKIMAGVVVACGGWPAVASANHVRPTGRTTSDGMGDPLATGLRGI